ncbi:hypothetical protein GUITHDRAFT_134642 [Guillardia theta CCMP2712]|uniref:F-box domain-containing protein n=1 Tax=Guillardia theta (strain CCMP2712) TaxID=905079 RepID=L1JRD2_GUITC|nr:hypothetical protein GUITHDRAFT_134642 [Guillardia theta CCMP2712]EKX51126.1 hypothetical protein GUITHDRAFT_134642 [Guillardia theta CCMP2712]|eukprot:XP_005838106.1 hypothetical protein GUITHDRAFT_134642 [Guillardia theta CCMP2712]
MGVASLSAVEQEVLLAILQDLRVLRPMHLCRQVSKAWMASIDVRRTSLHIASLPAWSEGVGSGFVRFLQRLRKLEALQFSPSFSLRDVTFQPCHGCEVTRNLQHTETDACYSKESVRSYSKSREIVTRDLQLCCSRCLGDMARATLAVSCRASVSSSNLRRVLEAIATCSSFRVPALTSLDFTGCTFDPDGIAMLTSAMREGGMPLLRSLCLERRVPSESRGQGAYWDGPLEELHLSLAADDFASDPLRWNEVLARVIGSCPSLTSLHFSEESLEQPAAYELPRAISSLHRLQTLRVHNCKRLEELSHQLLEDLNGCPSLTSLELRQNNLASLFCFSLKDQLQSGSALNLTRLDLKSNKLSQEGTQVLMSALQTHCPGQRGAKSLAEALVGNSSAGSLAVLNVSNNALDPPGLSSPPLPDAYDLPDAQAWLALAERLAPATEFEVYAFGEGLGRGEKEEEAALSLRVLNVSHNNIGRGEEEEVADFSWLRMLLRACR